jgi:hypothetical protein
MESGNIILYWRQEFRGMRLFDSYFIPTNWKLKCDITPNSDLEVVDLNIAIEKMEYWVKEILDGSVFINLENSWGSFMFNNGLSNNIVLCPGDPTDDTISELLQSKFSALVGSKIDIDYVEIESDTANNVNFIFTGPSSGNLPTMKDWMGDRTYFTQPWWNRDDTSSLDTIPDAGANLNLAPVYAGSMKFIEDAFLERTPPKNLAPVIKHEFRPHLVGEDKQNIKDRKRKK